jgi:hypothetical protein
MKNGGKKYMKDKVTITTWEKNEMRHRRKDSHLITGEEMNTSCLGTDGKWRYHGGRGDMPEEDRKRLKDERKVETPEEINCGHC